MGGREMIERLQYYLIKDDCGNCYGSNPPTISQITDKINEIIDTINQKEEQQ